MSTSSPRPDYTVSDTEAASRLDRFIAQRTGLSRAMAMRLIEEDKVRVDGQRGRKGLLLRSGQSVSLLVEPEDDRATPPPAQPELPLAVLHEDADLLVVNKPAGAPGHPLRAGERGSVASAVLARFPECAAASLDAREGGLCHRLDLHTSGALIIARSRDTWQAVRELFSEGRVEKEYLALVHGEPATDSFAIDLPLLPVRGTPRGEPQRMLVASTPEEIYRPDALDAHTQLVVEERGPGCALIRASSTSGRRHQIRAHLAHLGLPIAGDTLYGAPEESDAEARADGYFLHAARVRFPHSRSGQVDVTAPLFAGRQARLARALRKP